MVESEVEEAALEWLESLWREAASDCWAARIARGGGVTFVVSAWVGRNGQRRR